MPRKTLIVKNAAARDNATARPARDFPQNFRRGEHAYFLECLWSLTIKNASRKKRLKVYSCFLSIVPHKKAEKIMLVIRNTNMPMQAKTPMPFKPRCVVNKNPTKPAIVVVELAITLRPVVSINCLKVIFFSLS